MSLFDKLIFDRPKMVVRKLSKKNIKDVDWKIVDFSIASYERNKNGFCIRSLASSTYFNNLVRRWGTPEKIYEAYVWCIANGYINLDISNKFAESVAGEMLRDGVERAMSLNIDDYHKNLLQFYLAKDRQDYKEALKFLDIIYQLSSTLEQKRFFAKHQRSVYHILKDKWSMAEAGVRYLKDNPKLVDMGYCFHIVNCAGYSNNVDALSYSLNRILNDLVVLLKNDDLFKLEYVAAFETSLKIFSLKHAEAIVHKSELLQLPRALKLRRRLKKVTDEVQGWSHYVDSAFNQVKTLSRGNSIKLSNDIDFVVVISSAAFSFNKIDYPEFRSSLRLAYKYIFEACEQLGLRVHVDVRFGTHGVVNYDVPHVSYHTVGNSGNGLHFKETDRRHCLSFDPLGYSGWSSFSKLDVSNAEIFKDNYRFAEDFYDNDYLNSIVTGKSKYAQPNIIEKRLPEKFILIALQLEADAVNQLAFMSFNEMVDIVVKVASQAGVGVVVKRHPYCKSLNISNIIDKYSDLSNFVVSKGNIGMLIDKSIGVAVVNSSVGAEALVERKPVYVFGESEYMAACHICRNEEDFKRSFSMGESRLSLEEFHLFWLAFRTKYSFNIRDASAKDIIIERIKKISYK